MCTLCSNLCCTQNFDKTFAKKKSSPWDYKLVLGHREDVIQERKILKKKKKSHNFHKESTSNLQTLKKVQKNHCHLLSHFLWVSSKEWVWILCQKRVRKLQISTGCAAAEMHGWERHSREEKSKQAQFGSFRHKFPHFNKPFCAKASRQQILSWRNLSPIAHRFFFLPALFPK